MEVSLSIIDTMTIITRIVKRRATTMSKEVQEENRISTLPSLKALQLPSQKRQLATTKTPAPVIPTPPAATKKMTIIIPNKK
jgi:hypothetical protein